MTWLKTAVSEIVGLFVDDGIFTTAIVAWVALVWLLSAQILPGGPWTGVVLFAGLVAILIESVLRRARQ